MNGPLHLLPDRFKLNANKNTGAGGGAQHVGLSSLQAATLSYGAKTENVCVPFGGNIFKARYRQRLLKCRIEKCGDVTCT